MTTTGPDPTDTPPAAHPSNPAPFRVADRHRLTQALGVLRTSVDRLLGELDHAREVRAWSQVDAFLAGYSWGHTHPRDYAAAHAEATRRYQ